MRSGSQRCGLEFLVLKNHSSGGLHFSYCVFFVDLCVWNPLRVRRQGSGARTSVGADTPEVSRVRLTSSVSQLMIVPSFMSVDLTDALDVTAAG